VAFVHRHADRLEITEAERGRTGAGNVSDALDIRHTRRLALQQGGDLRHHLTGRTGSAGEANDEAGLGGRGGQVDAMHLPSATYATDAEVAGEAPIGDLFLAVRDENGTAEGRRAGIGGRGTAALGIGFGLVGGLRDHRLRKCLSMDARGVE